MKANNLVRDDTTTSPMAVFLAEGVHSGSSAEMTTHTDAAKLDDGKDSSVRALMKI